MRHVGTRVGLVWRPWSTAVSNPVVDPGDGTREVKRWPLIGNVGCGRSQPSGVVARTPMMRSSSWPSLSRGISTGTAEALPTHPPWRNLGLDLPSNLSNMKFDTAVSGSSHWSSRLTYPTRERSGRRTRSLTLVSAADPVGVIVVPLDLCGSEYENSRVRSSAWNHGSPVQDDR